MTTNTLTMGEKLHVIWDLIDELDDALSFMQTFEGEPQFIGCVCEAENEEQCTCVNEEGNHKRIEDKLQALKQTKALLNQMTKEYQDLYEEGESDESYRICSDCKEIMTEGFCIEGGLDYYCSETCLHKHMTHEQYMELYADGEGDSYWTTWLE